MDRDCVVGGGAAGVYAAGELAVMVALDAGILLIPAAVLGLAVLTVVLVVVFRIVARWLLSEDDRR